MQKILDEMFCRLGLDKDRTYDKLSTIFIELEKTYVNIFRLLTVDTIEKTLIDIFSECLAFAYLFDRSLDSKKQNVTNTILSHEAYSRINSILEKKYSSKAVLFNEYLKHQFNYNFAERDESIFRKLSHEYKNSYQKALIIFFPFELMKNKEASRRIFNIFKLYCSIIICADDIFDLEDDLLNNIITPISFVKMNDLEIKLYDLKKTVYVNEFCPLADKLNNMNVHSQIQHIIQNYNKSLMDFLHIS